jgi:hypothetical protein
VEVSNGTGAKFFTKVEGTSSTIVTGDRCPGGSSLRRSRDLPPVARTAWARQRQPV